MQRARRQPSRTIDSLDAAHALFASVFARARNERLLVAHLGAGDRLIGIRLRYAADCQAVELPVRAIIADAVTLASEALILAHNHPGGDPQPSHTDIKATQGLVRVAGPLGIRLRDHLIYAESEYVSMRSLGLL